MNIFLIHCLSVLGLLVATAVNASEPGSQFTSFAGFNLGTLRLDQVANKLGPVKLVETGDAGESTASICYRTAAGLIYFLSGEMGGPEHDLIGFGISESRPTNTRDCAIWPSSRAVPNLSLGNIHLGMSKIAFSSAVRAKVRWKQEVAYVAFESKRVMTPAETDRQPKDVQQAIQRGETQNYFDVMVSLMATFQDGKLTELRSWKIESL